MLKRPQYSFAFTMQLAAVAQPGAARTGADDVSSRIYPVLQHALVEIGFGRRGQRKQFQLRFNFHPACFQFGREFFK